MTMAMSQLCAKQCAANAQKKGRCLDIGCAVGGAVFEMARDFQEVVGFDFSAAFIEAADSMKVTPHQSMPCVILPPT